MASTKGIGYGIAKELVKKNHKIFIGSRNSKNLEQALKELNHIQPGNSYGSILDVNSFESIKNWVQEALKVFEFFDGILINYGGPPTGKFLEFSDQIWQDTFQYMLLNPIRFLKYIHPYLRENSSILFVTSFSVKEPVENLILSNVFRGAITALMKSLSKEWGPKIRLNCILPGRIDTERIRQIDSEISKNTNKSTEEIKKMFEDQIPLKRYGNIEEIGKVGVFLLTEESSYITGCNLSVDGGLLRSLL
ncbi:MAG: SDR family oxidoreductase [Leptonema sp. (in: bacteria)]